MTDILHRRLAELQAELALEGLPPLAIDLGSYRTDSEAEIGPWGVYYPGQDHPDNPNDLLLSEVEACVGMNGNSGDDLLLGDEGGCRFHGLQGDDIIFGAGGDDTIWGGLGDDTLIGGAGDDHLLDPFGANLLLGGAGNDVLDVRYGGSASHVEDLTLAEAQAMKRLQSDTLRGGDGDDQLYASWGHDHLFGGRGNDRIYGGDGFDVIHGGDGDDRIWGGRHNDGIYGGAGDDRLHGGRGYDYLHGGPGAYTFAFQSGGDFDRIGDFGASDRLLLERDLNGIDTSVEALQARIGPTIKLREGVQGTVLNLGSLSSYEHAIVFIDMTPEQLSRALETQLDYY